jgi:hypothetical protein
MSYDMNREEAYKILGIQSLSTEKEIKISYYKMALKYHPDKNPNNHNAEEKFKKINIAYQYLQKENENISIDSMNSKNYLSFIKECIKHFTPDVTWDDIFLDTTLNNAVDKCGKLSLKIFEKMGKEKSIELYSFLSKNKEIFCISEEILTKLQEIVKDKVKNDNIIILNPTLDDILNDSIYKLELLGKTFYVPLWHHEVVFDHSGQDIIVQCIPDLSDNVIIDNKNNLHYVIKGNIQNVLEKNNIEVKLGEKHLIIPSEQLNIVKKQNYIFRNKGLLRINDDDIYSTEERGHIFVDVEL